MQQWKYLVLPGQPSWGQEELEEALNEKASEGWELVTSFVIEKRDAENPMASERMSQLIFKRPYADERNS